MKKKDLWISLAIIAAAGLTLLFYSQRTGYVGIDAGGANAMLRLRNNWFGHKTITSGAEPAAIGARIYRPDFIRLSIGQGGHTCKIESRGPWGNLSKINVRNNEATAMKLGPPFLIKPVVKKKQLDPFDRLRYNWSSRREIPELPNKRQPGRHRSEN